MRSAEEAAARTAAAASVMASSSHGVARDLMIACSVEFIALLRRKSPGGLKSQVRGQPARPRGDDRGALESVRKETVRHKDDGRVDRAGAGHARWGLHGNGLVREAPDSLCAVGR